MTEKSITIRTRGVPKRARSKRWQTAINGGATVSTGGGATVANTTEALPVVNANSHTHENKPLLDSLSSTAGYLQITTSNTTAEGEYTSITEKAKAGFADVAQDLAGDSQTLKDLDSKYLSKQKDDTAKGAIAFEKGITVAEQARVNELIADLLTAGNGKITTLTANTAEVREKTTTLNLLVRALAEIYRLDVKSTAKMLQAVIQESLSSETFRSGFAGEGFRIYKDAVLGDWNMEIDRITVRKVFEVFEIRVQRLTHQGGMVISSPAGGEIAKVEDISTTEWRIMLKDPNTFAVEDLVLCQSFKATQGGKIKRYWRRCTAVGGDAIRLSKTEAEAGSAVPEAGDHIVTLGNINNPARQGAIIMSSVGSGSPYIATYAGINSFSLAGKEVMREGNLNGIVDSDFGALSGYGLYASRAYIKGELRTIAGKTIEQIAQEKADAIKIGGRNLLKGTAERVDVSTPRVEYLLHTYVGVESLITGETYTISFDLQTFEGKTARVMLYYHQHLAFEKDYNPSKTAGKQRVVITFTATRSHKDLNIYNGRWDTTAEQRQNNAFILSKLKLEKGNKPTDWSPAPEDYSTTEELNAVRTEFQVRDGEISAKVQQVTTSVNTAKTYSDKAKNQADRATTQASTATTQAQNATTANTQAQQALTSVRSVESSITQKAGEITASVTSAKSYADRAEKTYNAIKVSENSIVVESAKKAVEGVQIGGRNLLKGTAKGVDVSSPSDVYLQRTYEGVENLVTGEIYTISFDLQTYTGKSAMVMPYFHQHLAFAKEYNPSKTAGKQRVVITFTATRSDKNLTIYNGRWDTTAEQRQNNAFILSKLKLEKGNKATDWTPAPEDYSTTEEIKSSLTMTPDKITLLGKQVSLTGQITFSAFSAETIARLTDLNDKTAQILGYANAQDARTKTANGRTIINGGYINTELLQANSVEAKHIKSGSITADKLSADAISVQTLYTSKERKGARVEIHGTQVDIYGAVARNMRLGISPSGKAQLEYYDDEGNLLYYLGENGIKYSDVRPEFWKAREFRYFGTDITDLTVRSITFMNYNSKARVTYHEFNSRMVGPTITDEVRDGNTHTQPNHTSAKIPNGWYYATYTVYRKDDMVGIKPVPGAPYTPAFGFLRDLMRPDNPAVDLDRDLYELRIVHYVNGKAEDSRTYYSNS